MKAQRRHELQENVLGLELGKAVSFFKKYGTYLAWGVLIVALTAAVVGYSVRKKRSQLHDLHTRYQRVMTDPALKLEDRLGELKALADQDRDSALAAEACLAVADDCAWMLTAAGGMTPPAERRAHATEAEASYRKAIRRFPDRPEIVGRARLGLARLAETRRDFEAAKAEYEAVLAMPALRDAPLAAAAKKGLAGVKEFRSPVEMATTAPAPREDRERK